MHGNWLHSESESLEGFQWCGGVQPITTGINIWNRIFTYDPLKGPKIAIILIDTQGTFDHQTTIEDCTMIFALSTLLSSVQIFNVMQSIQENDLQHLQLFAEFGSLAANKSDCKPFQKLLFLVRDWGVPYDYSFGFEGGSKYVQKEFFDCSNSKEQHQSLRNHIQSCFEEIDCFLMPHPGLKVSASKNFKGSLDDISDEFKDNLKPLIEHLLAPRNLIPKTVNGCTVTCEDFVEYFKQYFGAFEHKIPLPMTIMDANAKVQNNRIAKECRKLYYTNITSIECSCQEYTNKLKETHETARKEAFGWLVTNSIGSFDMKMEYENELNSYTDEKYKNLLENHEQNELVMENIKKCYSDRVEKFDKPLDRYLDKLKTEHEIAKGIALDMISEKLLIEGTHAKKMFDSELKAHTQNVYTLSVQNFQNNQRVLASSQEKYSVRLESITGTIEEYVRILEREHESAKEMAREFILANPLKGHPQIVNRFYEVLEIFFEDVYNTHVKLFNYSLIASEECKNIYKSKLLEIDPNSHWEYVDVLKKEHKVAKLAAIDTFQEKASGIGFILNKMFKDQIATFSEEFLLFLLTKFEKDMNGPMKHVYRYWSFMSKPMKNISRATMVSAMVVAAAAPLEVAVAPVVGAAGAVGTLFYLAQVAMDLYEGKTPRKPDLSVIKNSHNVFKSVFRRFQRLF